MTNNIFIQARMSSNRFPGKVLAPFMGKPLIQHIIERARQVKDVGKVVVLTSLDSSDDPLASYLEHIDCDCFRGDLNNVFQRFQGALKAFPCEYFVRLCADSPLLDPNLIDSLLDFTHSSNYDLISNVYSRGFPKGQALK